MAQLVAFFLSALDVPLVAPGNLPTIRVRRIDTQVLVATDAAMVEIGDGQYAFDLTTDDALEYSWRANGDPTASGQTVFGGRYVFGVASGVVDGQRAAILADTAAIDARLPPDPADESNQIAEHDTTQAAIAALGPFGLTAAETTQLRYVHKQIGGDPLQIITHVDAEEGGPNGSISSPDGEIDVVVIQTGENTATFEQQ